MANLEDLSNNTDTNKITVLQWFCPYANLFWASQRQIQFKSYYEVLFSALKIMGAIESINEEELEEYTKNPSITNLINISYQSFKHDKIEEKMKEYQMKINEQKEKIEDLKEKRR